MWQFTPHVTITAEVIKKFNNHILFYYATFFLPTIQRFLICPRIEEFNIDFFINMYIKRNASKMK